MKTINITFGRFCPVSIRHNDLFNQLPDPSIIMITSTIDDDKNIFPPELKKKWIETLQPNKVCKIIKNPFQGFEEIQNSYDSFNLLVGEDRKELVEKIQKYYPEKSINIKWIKRDFVSATKIRQALKDNNWDEFIKMVDNKVAVDIWENYNAIRFNKFSTIAINE